MFNQNAPMFRWFFSKNKHGPLRKHVFHTPIGGWAAVVHHGSASGATFATSSAAFTALSYFLPLPFYAPGVLELPK